MRQPVYDTLVVELFDGLKALRERHRSVIVLRIYLGPQDDEIAPCSRKLMSRWST